MLSQLSKLLHYSRPATSSHVGHIYKSLLATSAPRRRVRRRVRVARARKSGEHTDYGDAGVVEEGTVRAVILTPVDAGWQRRGTRRCWLAGCSGYGGRSV